MEKILLTGATGYIGNYLLSYFNKSKNCQLAVITRKTSNKNLIFKINKNIPTFPYNGEYSSALDAISSFKPDSIIHLASMQAYDYNSKDIDLYLESNLIFGIHLAEAAKKVGVKKFINTGTYWQHYNNKKYYPVSIYAAMKQAFQNILKFYNVKNYLKSITLILFDVYGPKDKRNKIFTILNNATNKKSSLKLTPGKQQINMVHIEDVVSAYFSCLKNFELLDHDTYYVRTDNVYKLTEIVEKYIDLSGKKIKVEWGSKKYKEMEIMEPPTIGKNLPYWYPTYDLEEGIKSVLKYQ